MDNLIVRAKHFKDARFMNNENCSLAKAAREQFGFEKVSEGVSNFIGDGKRYYHERYDHFMYVKDFLKAQELNFSDEIIREIKFN